MENGLEKKVESAEFFRVAHLQKKNIIRADLLNSTDIQSRCYDFYVLRG